MKNIRIFIGIVALLVCVTSTYSQETYSFKGKVVSPYNNTPISGAIISLSNSNISTQTDENGTFSINVMPGSEIDIWAPGFYNLTEVIAGNEMKFVMVPLIMRHIESYVTPFGEIKQKDKASAMGNIDQENFISGGLFIDDVISGTIPGLRITKSSGMPGEGSFMNSRGIGSMIAGTTPLLVIDGVPYLPDMNESPIIGGYSYNIFNAFSAADIKKITFLKGAEASSYGSMGSNGVLLIETDDATDLQTRVALVCQYGVSSLPKEMPVMDVHDYKTYIGDIALTHYDDMADILTDFPFLQDDPDYYYSFLYDNESDWQRMIMKPSFVTENVLKIKGGDAIAKYDFSFGYLNQAGIIKNSGLSRYNMRLNANINISKKMDFFASMSMAYLINDLHEQGMIPETNPILAALAKSPLVSAYEQDEYGNTLPEYASVYDDDGEIQVNNAVSNPLALVNTSKIYNKGYDVLMNGGVNYHFNDNLTFTGTIGLYNNYNRTGLFIPGVSSGAIMPLLDGLAENTVREGIRETFNMYYGVKASYKNKLPGKGKINAVAGWQAITTHKEFDAGEGRNTSSDFYKTLDYVSTVGRSFYGYIDLWNWMNAYVHGTYTYNNLASVGVNLSVDGTSSSGDDAPRFGLFPSVNTAFYLSNLEPIRNLNFVNNLKLRAEYVITGNSNFASNLSDYYYVNQVFQELSGIVRAGIPNTGLKWENNRTINVGLDFAGFNKKFDLTIDLYNSLASDVILAQKISSAFGVSSLYDNVATIQNSGVEVGIQGYLINTRNFNFMLGATIAKNKNTMKDMAGEDDIIHEFEDDGSAVVTHEGESVYTFYGYKTDGIYSTTEDAEAANLTNAGGTYYEAGDVKYIDQNGDGKINKYDRVVIGNPNPKLFGGIYGSLAYQQFSIDFHFTYSYGNDIYNALRREFESMDDFGNQLVSTTRRWKEEGQVTDMPRALYGDPIGNSDFSDRWIEDGSYLKLKTLTLNYNIKRGAVKFMQSGSVYLTVENLVTFSKYLGYDPEFSYSYEPYKQGIDFGKAPQPRTFKFGFALQF